MSDKLKIIAVADEDYLAVKTAFLSLLVDLAPFGHDVKATEQNADVYWMDVFASALATGRDSLFLAKLGDRVVGALFWVIYDGKLELNEPTALDHGCWVHLDHRRQGVATALRKAGMSRLRELGITALTSSISYLNKAGTRSYKKLNPAVTGFITKVRI